MDITQVANTNDWLTASRGLIITSHWGDGRSGTETERPFTRDDSEDALRRSTRRRQPSQPDEASSETLGQSNYVQNVGSKPNS